MYGSQGCRRRSASLSRAPSGAAKQRDRYGAGGFTLFGLVVAFALLGLASAIALASINRSRVVSALQDSRHIVTAAVSLARSSAMGSGRPATVRIDSQSDRLWVEVGPSAGVGSRLDTLGYFSFAELRVDLSSNRKAMCFDGRGIGTTNEICRLAGGVIILSLGEYSDTVIVSPLGRVLP